MRNIVLSRGFRSSRAVLTRCHSLYPSICTTRAASLNSAIDRGIRRSQGVGFKGKESKPPSHGSGNAPIRRTGDPPTGAFSNKPMTKTGWRGSMESTPENPQRGRFGEILKTPPRHSPNIRVGKRVFNEVEEEPRGWQGRSKHNNSSSDKRSSGRRDDVGDRASPRGKFDARTAKRPFERSDQRFGHSETQRQPREFQKYRDAPEAREGGRPARNQNWEHRGKENSFESGTSSRFANSKPTYPSLEPRKSSFGGPRAAERPTSRYFSKENGRDRKDFADRDASPRKDEGGPPRFTKSIDKRMPLSIPYTTPASEFLYGTSVVEAALRSKRDPRRKLYKLYIYTGENRESADRDADLERLARRSGIEVARVGTDWLPLLDKMSASRPHNGYILEASPLPRLPVTSLGALTEQNGNTGFEVTIDHQSREDAAINGTSSFVKSSKNNSGKKPLVLFLDSIVDAGNLGGIIRTASFLGASAVAISKNCTSFSPIVLKASAGASENITLFTVNKPAGFIADSKLAGWKIFAAVAPAAHSSPRFSSQISTDDLVNPLSDDPCILMLGSEGEGLRMNLITKADVQLSIRGSGENKEVDSLNVSVATGILCNAFLRRSGMKTGPPIQQEAEGEQDVEQKGDLF